MDRISIESIVEATGGALMRKSSENFITGVKHDSRECSKGDMFVAVVGENHDGHDYLRQVLENGCKTVLVSCDESALRCIGDMEANVIKVKDTVYAMGELAKYYLDTLAAVKIAVTGSVGKTSTRDMIYYALGEKHVCGRNMKNYNNDIGLPLSVFQFDSRMDAVVLEMGMDHSGEIERLSEIVRPNIAVITNIGTSHIENLGSREEIFRAKMEITKYMEPYGKNKSTLIFPTDDEFLTKKRTAGDYEQVTIGRNGKSDYIISDIDDFGLDGIKFTLEYQHESRTVNIPVPGRHSAVNGTIAIAVCGILGMSMDDAIKGLAETQLTGNRLRHLKNGRLSVIDDTYNASPDSMKSALTVLNKSRCRGKKTAILGDMYELGKQSERQHFGIGVFARGLDLDRIIAVGEKSRAIAEGAKGGKAQVLYFKTKDELYREIKELASAGDMILVKGSRGMGMEEIVDKLLDI